MKKTMLILPLTAALLAACQGATPVPVTLNTLTLGGVSSTLQISAPAKLAVSATGSDGNPYTGTATFTSSDPSVIAVAADGTLTVRHLSVAPVVLTVSEAGKTASTTVTTYGLDVVGGTYRYTGGANNAPGYNFLLALRNADGTAVKTDTTVTVQGPSTFNGGAVLTFLSNNNTVDRYAVYRDSAVPSVSGTYTATANVAGVVYNKTFTIDATQVQPFASGLSLNITRTGYAASGTLPDGSPLVYGVIITSNNIGISSTDFLTALPATGNLSTPLVVGQQYAYGAYAQNFLGTSGKPFPDQVNRSFTYIGSTTITQ